MAKRVMLMSEWQRLCAETYSPDDPASLAELGGPSPGGAAWELGVSRQRVHQLLDQGKLDAVYLKDHPKAEPHVIMVTQASIARWKRSKPGSQQDLPFVKPKAKLGLRPGKRG